MRAVGIKKNHMFGKLIRKIINSSDGFKKFICPYSGSSYILQVEDLNYVDFKFVNGDFKLITILGYIYD